VIAVRYLLDNNALNKLTPEQRASPFVHEHCRIPAEVLHEAQRFPDIAGLREIGYAMSAELLETLKRVMASVPPDDRKLIDLYSNTGNADPILVAVALHATDDELDSLFQNEWQIVTNDAAVHRKAAEFGVSTLESAEFLRILNMNS
jgi:hypothetical protein